MEVEGGEQTIQSLKHQEEMIDWLGMIYKELKNMRGSLQKKVHIIQ